MDFFELFLLAGVFFCIVGLFVEPYSVKSTEIMLYIPQTNEQRLRSEMLHDLHSPCKKNGELHDLRHLQIHYTPRDHRPDRLIGVYRCNQCDCRLSATMAAINRAKEIYPAQHVSHDQRHVS